MRIVAGLFMTLMLGGAAAAQSGSISRTRFTADMDAQFKAIDTDGNGLLSAPEIEASQRAAAAAAASKRNRTLFEALDTDRDGRLTQQEFDRFNNPPPNTANAAPMLGRMDSNRDRQVSLAEHRAALLANFDRLDSNRDGIVSAAEMKAGGALPR
jgi:Ca2+-binding EF-hand superfamily protein